MANKTFQRLVPLEYMTSRDCVLDPSYMDAADTRFALGVPRIYRHFYALSLHDLGEHSDGPHDSTNIRFDVTHAEREEFPELEGVISVTVKTDRNGDITGWVQYGYACFIPTDAKNHPPFQLSMVLPEKEDVVTFMVTMDSHPATKRMFQGREPYVALFNMADRPVVTLSQVSQVERDTILA